MIRVSETEIKRVRRRTSYFNYKLISKFWITCDVFVDHLVMGTAFVCCGGVGAKSGEGSGWAERNNEEENGVSWLWLSTGFVAPLISLGSQVLWGAFFFLSVWVERYVGLGDWCRSHFHSGKIMTNIICFYPYKLQIILQVLE